MTRCLRCATPSAENRRHVALRDFTDATAAHYEGALCSRCWEIVVGELLGVDVGKPKVTLEESR